MNGVPWRSQIAVGRVFELKTRSKLPPACALILRDKRSWERDVKEVDRFGAVVNDGPYTRQSNNRSERGIYALDDHFIRRIKRRRPDMERFDCYDIDLMRYGCSVDFDGRMRATNIPPAKPGTWTMFWVPAETGTGFWWEPNELRQVMKGEWHFSEHGGRRDLGYKFGYKWATLHTGPKLQAIRQLLRRLRPDVIEMQSTVRYWREGKYDCKGVFHKASPAFGLGAIWRTDKNYVTCYGE